MKKENQANLDNKIIDSKNRREFLKKTWAIPTLIALGNLEASAKQGGNLSELCDKTNENSLFCKCLEDPNYSPACSQF